MVENALQTPAYRAQFNYILLLKSILHFDFEFIKLLIPATGSHSPFICMIKELSTTRKLSSCGQLQTTNNSLLNLLLV